MSTAHVAWWVWAILVLMLLLVCASLSGGSRGPLQAGKGAWSPPRPPTQGDMPDGFDGRRDTPHFVLVWRQGETTREEIDAAVAHAEFLFAKLADELGAAQTPQASLIVMFEEPAITPTGQWRIPYVDRAGRIHLLRFPGLGGGYLGKLGHELVHAFRSAWRSQRSRPEGVAYSFVEEGFAEWIATRLEPHSLAFPYYGFSVHLVAGQWLIRDEAPPLRVLLERHRDLNPRCLTQAYALRGAFFQYLHDTYGKEAVFRLAYAEDEMTPVLFAQIFDQDFDTLAGDWRAATLAR